MPSTCGATQQPLLFSPLPEPSFALPQTNMQCYDLVRKHTRRKPTWYRRYPATVADAAQWLKKAIHDKQILWQPGRILAHIQTAIDNHQHGRMFLLFGNNHSIAAQYRFFNELWHPGKDGIQLEGITHLALEAFVSGITPKPLVPRYRQKLRRLWQSRLTLRTPQSRLRWRQQITELLISDQQPLLDLYLRHGDHWAYQMVEVINHFLLGQSYPTELLHEIHATLQYMRKYHRTVEVIATDMSQSLKKNAQRSMCWIYPLREMFSLHVTQRRLKHKRSVVVFMWGADHIRKDHLPRFLSPTDRVLAVRLSGGSAPNVWDMALARLNLPLQMFAIPTPGAREGDFLIHLPPQDSELARSLRNQTHHRAYMSRYPRSRLLVQSKSGLVSSYPARINHKLQRLRFDLISCVNMWPGKKIPIELEISSEGVVEQVSFPGTPKLHRQQRRCLRQWLWKRTMPKPPNHRSVQVLFVLRVMP